MATNFSIFLQPLDKIIIHNSFLNACLICMKLYEVLGNYRVRCILSVIRILTSFYESLIFCSQHTDRNTIICNVSFISCLIFIALFLVSLNGDINIVRKCCLLARCIRDMDLTCAKHMLQLGISSFQDRSRFIPKLGYFGHSFILVYLVKFNTQILKEINYHEQQTKGI